MLSNVIVLIEYFDIFLCQAKNSAYHAGITPDIFQVPILQKITIDQGLSKIEPNMLQLHINPSSVSQNLPIILTLFSCHKLFSHFLNSSLSSLSSSLILLTWKKVFYLHHSLNNLITHCYLY